MYNFKTYIIMKHQEFLREISSAVESFLKGNELPQKIVERLTEQPEGVSSLAYEREIEFFFHSLKKEQQKMDMNLPLSKVVLPSAFQKSLIKRIQHGQDKVILDNLDVIEFSRELHGYLWTILEKRPNFLAVYIEKYPLEDNVLNLVFQEYPAMIAPYIKKHELSIQMLLMMWRYYWRERQSDVPDYKVLQDLRLYTSMYIKYHEVPPRIAQEIWRTFQTSREKGGVEDGLGDYIKSYLHIHPLPQGVVEATFSSDEDLIDRSLASMEVNNLMDWSSYPFSVDNEIAMIKYCDGEDFRYYLKKFKSLSPEAQRALWCKEYENKVKIYIDVIGKFTEKTEDYIISSIDVSKWPASKELAKYYRDNSSVPIKNVERYNLL